MSSIRLLIHFASQNIALLCAALFAGGAKYLSLVERPAIAEGGPALTGTYLLLTQQRPMFFHTFFAAAGGLAGIAAGITGNAALWLVGGLALVFAVLIQLVAVLPETRSLFQSDLTANPVKASNLDRKLTRLHSTQTLAGLASLAIFILQV